MILAVNGRALVTIPQEDYLDEILSGKTPLAGQCLIAVKTAESQVNTSYLLYLFDSTRGTITSSRLDNTTNPDFLSDRIITSHREAARWFHEDYCYSNADSDYYLCQRREEIDEHFEKFTNCTPTQCTPAGVIDKTTQTDKAYIKKKAFIYQKRQMAYYERRAM